MALVNETTDTSATSPVDAAPEREPASILESVLKTGKFAVTAEIVPPKVPSLNAVTKKVNLLKDIVDGINVTDNASAAVKMSSLAVCIHIASMGVEPVFQITSRDRNRIAIQADMIGAHALGVRNVFAVTGDFITMGDHPAAKPVYDMDSVLVVDMLNDMRRGYLQCGDELRTSPRFPVHTPNFFLGAAANPFADPMPFHIVKTAKKRLAGADFIQSQCTFDLPRFREFMKMYVDAGLHEQLYFLVGIMPCKSCRPLEFMKASVPGMSIPDDSIKRIQSAENGEEEGVNMAVEIIEEVKGIEGVNGIHIMTVSWEAVIPEILKRAGLTPEDRDVVDIYAAKGNKNGTT